MFLQRFENNMVADEVISAIIYDSVDLISAHEFIGRKIYCTYDNDDIYELMKESGSTSYSEGEELTKEMMDDWLKHFYKYHELTPKMLKNYVKTFFKGVKLTNVKVRDWDDISFTIKFTAIEYSWWYKKLAKLRNN